MAEADVLAAIAALNTRVDSLAGAITGTSTVLPDRIIVNTSMESDSNSDGVTDGFSTGGTQVPGSIYSRVQQYFGSGNYQQRVQYTGVPGDVNTIVRLQGDKVAVSGLDGQTVRMRYVSKATLTGGATLTWLIQSWNSSQAYINSASATESITTSAKVFDHTFVIPAGTAYLSIGFQGSVSNGQSMDVSLDTAMLYIPNYSSPLLVAAGDSITWGAGAVNGVSDYPTLLKLPSHWTRHNLGLPAHAILYGTGQLPVPDSLYSASRPTNILLFWAGTNDLALYSRTPQQVFDDTVAYCAARRAVGWKVVAFTMLPRLGMVTSGTFEADRLTFNAMLRERSVAFADGLVDVASDPRLADASDTYWYPDTLHPSAAGNAVIAELATSVAGSISDIGLAARTKPVLLYPAYDAAKSAATQESVNAAKASADLANRVAPATPTDLTNAQEVITTAITNKPVTPATDLTGLEAAIAAAAAQLYAAGSGSVSLGTPITSEALVERGTDALLTFDADTTGRTSTLRLYPQGSTTAALTVAGTASGATTAVALTDTQTTALNGVYRMVLDSTLGDDTVRHIDGLLVAT